MTDITTILHEASNGDQKAAADLIPILYDELKKLAGKKMAGENPGQTLSTTALVHEAYLRLVKPVDENKWNSLGHFYAAAAESMRRILIERARSKQRIKHGGDFTKVNLVPETLAAPEHGIDTGILELNSALEVLEENHPEVATVVKLRYFSGLKMSDVGKYLQLSTRTVQRHWAFAKAFMLDDINRRQGF